MFLKILLSVYDELIRHVSSVQVPFTGAFVFVFCGAAAQRGPGPPHS